MAVTSRVITHFSFLIRMTNGRSDYKKNVVWFVKQFRYCDLQQNKELVAPLAQHEQNKTMSVLFSPNLSTVLYFQVVILSHVEGHPVANR